jgi:hypothetical protein
MILEGSLVGFGVIEEARSVVVVVVVVGLMHLVINFTCYFFLSMIHHSYCHEEYLVRRRDLKSLR